MVQPNLQKSDTVITTVLVAPLVLFLLEVWELFRLEERVKELHAFAMVTISTNYFVSLKIDIKYVVFLTSKSATTAINT